MWLWWWKASLILFPSYLDVDRDGKSSMQEFYDMKVVQILKIIFEGLDVNSDGLVKQDEAYLKSLISPGFLRNITGEVFDFFDKDNDGDVDMEDITKCEPFCVEPLGLAGNKTVEVCALLGFPLDQICTVLMTTLLSPNYRQRFDMIYDVRVEQSDLEKIIVDHIFGFFVTKEDQAQVSLEDFAEGLARLGEPPIVTDSLIQLLTPIVKTFPRMLLQALVSSADKNSDGGMDWQEFEGFGDFDLAFRTRRQMTAALSDNILAGMNTCEGDQKCLPALWTMEELKRYFSTPSVINRLVTNLVFHPDFQFPRQTLQE